MVLVWLPIDYSLVPGDEGGSKRCARRGHPLAHEVVYHLFRGQLLLQQTDDPTGLFLLLQEVAITSTQQPVEKGHGPAPDISPASSVLPISTATRQAPAAVFRQIVT